MMVKKMMIDEYVKLHLIQPDKQNPDQTFSTKGYLFVVI